MRNINIIIAGSRGFDDYDKLKEVLDEYIEDNKLEKVAIISGNARGADRLGERYAKEHGYSAVIFKADWDRLGKRAGYLRNLDMGDYGDVLIAFWDGVSRGTSHMIDIMIAKHKEVKIIKY